MPLAPSKWKISHARQPLRPIGDGHEVPRIPRRFQPTFDSLDGLRNWANGLVAQYGLKGEKLKIQRHQDVYSR